MALDQTHLPQSVQTSPSFGDLLTGEHLCSDLHSAHHTGRMETSQDRPVLRRGETLETSDDRREKNSSLAVPNSRINTHSRTS